MAPPKTKAPDGPVSLSARTTSRQIKLKSWGNLQTAQWKNMTNAQKKKFNVTTKSAKRPLGSLYIFPSQDPYTANQRMEFRAINENVSWINRAVRILVQAVVGSGYTTDVEPRDQDNQMKDEELDAWKRETRFSIPWANDEVHDDGDGNLTGGWTALEIEQFAHNLSVKLDLQFHESRAYRYTLEQGQCGIGIFPEMKYTREGEPDISESDPDAQYIMPELLRTIQPEHNVRVWLDMDTGEMASLQIIGLSSRGGKLPVERLIWLTSEHNLELNSSYYGESHLLPLLDTGKVMIILYGKDFTEAAQYTWHQPKVFKVTVPQRDYKRVSTVLKEFLNKANNSAGRDIAVTQSVELLSGTSNPGDISGLIEMDDHLIDQIAGYFNIPPFLLSKGKAGNLGGDAQLEEIDAFLNVEVRPQQEIVETFIEKQFYDRILQILFNEKDVDKIPIKLVHNLAKPDIQTLFDKDQYEIMLDLVQRGYLSEDKMIKRLNLENAKDEMTVSQGTDATPGKAQWKSSTKRNPHWNSQSKGSWSSWKNKGKWKEPPFWSKQQDEMMTQKQWEAKMAKQKKKGSAPI